MRNPSMKSTEWRNAMTPDTPRLFSTDTNLLADPVRIALVQRLEVSLQSSARATVSRNLRELEQATEEQTHLLAELRASNTTSREHGDPAPLPAFARSRDTCRRVLELCRLQRALLARAQRSLDVLAHWMAGPGASYTHPQLCLPAASSKRGSGTNGNSSFSKSGS